jgi:hypothetical protein
VSKFPNFSRVLFSQLWPCCFWLQQLIYKTRDLFSIYIYILHFKKVFYFILSTSGERGILLMEEVTSRYSFSKFPFQLLDESKRNLKSFSRRETRHGNPLGYMQALYHVNRIDHMHCWQDSKPLKSVIIVHALPYLQPRPHPVFKVRVDHASITYIIGL